MESHDEYIKLRLYLHPDLRAKSDVFRVKIRKNQALMKLWTYIWREVPEGSPELMLMWQGGTELGWQDTAEAIGMKDGDDVQVLPEKPLTPQDRQTFQSDPNKAMS